MKIPKHFTIGSCILIALSCNHPNKEILPKVAKVLAIDSGLHLTPPNSTLQDTINDSLRLYFDNPLDFYKFKKNMHMLNGGSFNLKNEYFHAVEDKKYIYYDYWAYEFDINKNSNRSLAFKVLKPWTKGTKERYYSTDNEILIGIKSKISTVELQQSNFVGLSENAIIERFGPPFMKKNANLLYVHEDKILLLHTQNHQIQWFKYIWCANKIDTSIEFPEELFIF